MVLSVGFYARYSFLRANPADYSLYNYNLYTLRSHTGGDGLQRDGAFQPLALQFTSDTVGAFYVTVDKQIGALQPPEQ